MKLKTYFALLPLLHLHLLPHLSFASFHGHPSPHPPLHVLSCLLLPLALLVLLVLHPHVFLPTPHLHPPLYTLLPLPPHAVVLDRLRRRRQPRPLLHLRLGQPDLLALILRVLQLA